MDQRTIEKWKRVCFFFEKKKDKEDNLKKGIKEVSFFFKGTIFLKGDTYEKKFSTKKTQGDDKTPFLESWREGFFSKQEEITTKGTLHKA